MGQTPSRLAGKTGLQAQKEQVVIGDNGKSDVKKGRCPFFILCWAGWDGLKQQQEHLGLDIRETLPGQQ